MVANSTPLRTAVVRLPRSTTFFAVGLGVLAFAVSWPNNALVPEVVRLAIYDGRPLAIAGGIAALAGFVLLFEFDRVAAYLVAPGRFVAILLALAFPLYYALLTAFRGQLSAPVLGLYALWFFMSFFLGPICLGTGRALAWAVLAMGAGFALAWAAALGLALTFDTAAVIPGLQTRGLELLVGEEAPYGFMNGNYFAQMPQLLIVFVWFPWRRPWPRSVRIALTVLLFTAIAACRARNVLVFMAVFALAYPLLRRGPGATLFLTFLGIMGASLLTITVLDTDTAELNRVSTGRLHLWEGLWNAVLGAPSPTAAFWFGPSEFIDNVSIKAYDPLTAAKGFTKLHVDNAVLELMLEGGLLGVVLFAAPYAVFAKRALSRLSGGGDPTAAWGLALSVALLAQSLFVSTIPSFNNPVGLVYAAVAGRALLGARDARRRLRRPVVATGDWKRLYGEWTPDTGHGHPVPVPAPQRVSRPVLTLAASPRDAD